MIQGKVNVKTLLNKLYRDLGINTDIPESDVLEWVSEALLFIGAFGQFDPSYNLKIPLKIETIKTITIDNTIKLKFLVDFIN